MGLEDCHSIWAQRPQGLGCKGWEVAPASVGPMGCLKRYLSRSPICPSWGLNLGRHHPPLNRLGRRPQKEERRRSQRDPRHA